MDISSNTIWMNSLSSDERAYIIDKQLGSNTETVGTTESITIQSAMPDIMNHDFVANESALSNVNKQSKYEVEDNYFGKFDWLNDTRNILDDDNSIKIDMDSIPNEERLNMFLECCKLIEKNNLMILDVDEGEGQGEGEDEDLETAPLFMYHISLENHKMMLHVDFKKDYDTVLSDCTKLYDFVRTNAPLRVVYISEVLSLYDVDKDVKLYMNMFGIENTRGGSYSDKELPDFLTKALLHEGQITDVKFYIGRKI